MNKIELICEHCGKKYFRYKSQIVSKNQFCSRECADKFRLKCVFACEICGKVFHRPQKKGVKAKYCSQKCRGIGLSGKLLMGDAYYNKQCVVCGKGIHVTDFQIKIGEGRYCSYDCKNIGTTCKFKGVKIAHYYQQSFWKKLRLEILERDGFKCINCGYNPEDKSELQVNHIRFRELGGSDNPENLETLCKSCHAKKDAFRLKVLSENPKARMRDYKKYIDVLLKKMV